MLIEGVVTNNLKKLIGALLSQNQSAPINNESIV
jgi:hypothetical protein